METKNNLIYFIATTISMAIADQISKKIIVDMLALRENFVLIPNTLSLEKVYNTGAAFSTFQNNTALLVTISILTIFIITLFTIIKRATLMKTDFIAFGFITGGAIGNLIDRIHYSYVIDFIQLDFINFPIFNFADIFINVGVIVLILGMLFNKNE